MDKEQARFILQSFRPDGADAKDPDFAEALVVAAEDRELGDWLATERAQDAAFAAALNDLAIPVELRDNILTVLKGDNDAESFGEMDASFIGALASVRPPDGLRDQIVSAMKVEVSSDPVEVPFPLEESTGTREVQKTTRRLHGWLKSAAVAAALVLGAFVAFEITSDDDDPGGGGLAILDVERSSIQHVVSESGLEHQGADLAGINRYFASRNVPTISQEDLPRGLIAQGVKPVGCTLLKLGEKNASLLCFDKNGENVHLVVLRRADLKEKELANLETLKEGGGTCWQCPASKLSVATWGNKERAFVLLGDTDPEKLRAEIF